MLTVECSIKQIRVYSTTANAYIAGKAANVACRVEPLGGSLLFLVPAKE